MFAALLCALASNASAQLAVSGRPVPELAQLDTIMSNFMNDPARSISAGVLGVSRGGRVVFLHGYGTLRAGVNLPENALFRQASVVKPITAAAVHRFAQNGGLGANQLQRPAFNLSANGGVLNITLPASTPLGDGRMAQITVGHLLNHSAGWDRNSQPITNPWLRDFPITQIRAAGIQMNEPDALPTRPQLVGWALQFPLDYTPGAASYTQPVPNGSAPGTLPVVMTPGPGATYSNFGYLVLGEILEAQAPGGYLGYLRGQIMSAANWIPSSEWGPARTLAADTDAREPGYVGSFTGPSVFDYVAPIDQVPLQYGGYHVETMLAHGGLVASSEVMLRFGNLFSVLYQTRGAGSTQSNDIGLPLSAANAMPNAAHTGSLPGTSTILQQIGGAAGTDDDVVIHIAFNERDSVADWAAQASTQVVNYLNTLAANAWPTASCDGFWTALGAENSSAGSGAFNSSFQGFASALNRVADGSFLRLRSGHQAWTGTITKRVRLDAPEGVVVLGQ
jgi:CubicO group peptidase (beta-lactamase class C family)